jgi:hypothetical protein
MQRNRLENLLIEISEQIFTLVSHLHTSPDSTLTLAKLLLDDVLNLRLVCRQIELVASAVADRFIHIPLGDQPLDSHHWNLSRKQARARKRANTLLSKTHVAVRRCILTGSSHIYDNATTKLSNFSATQISLLANTLGGAHNLQYLTVRRLDCEMVLPIVRRLAQWPRLHRLDISISTTSSFLDASHLRCLTLRLTRPCRDLNKIPALPMLSRLKIEGTWPASEWDLSTSVRLDFTQYPQLTWLKVCGIAPEQFLDIFEGRTTSIKRCIIGNARDAQSCNELEFFGQRAFNFFSCFAMGLEALIIHSGKIEPITNVFPKLRSLKLPTDIVFDLVEQICIRNCPQLVQLSLISRELYSPDQVNSLVADLVPLYASTLQSLQLVKDPYQYYQRDSSKWLEELSTDTIYRLSLCKHIKFLEISGFLYICERNAKKFGEEHTELEAVMLTYPAFGGYKESELRVRDSSRDPTPSNSSANIKYRDFSRRIPSPD